VQNRSTRRIAETMNGKFVAARGDRFDFDGPGAVAEEEQA
jgi:hypothetical protein